MNKVNLDIPRKEDGKWGSYISKYPADSGKVPANAMTADTRNVITSATGQAEKRLGGAIWNATSLLSAGALDQYEGIFQSGARLLIVNDAGTLKASTGNGVFASITAGYTNPANFEFATYQNRVYGCNGVDAPIVMDTVTSYGGVSYVFTTAKTKVMGAQAPGSAATATRATDSTANQVPAGSHRYKITFVYYNGVEESNGSAASSVCVNDSTHTSNSLTSIPVGGYGCTARNIYRDNNDGVYLLLATISNNTATTYTDILTIGSTPTPMPVTNDVPGIFKYITLYLDRLFTIDITGKNISWSTAGEPDIFDPENVISGPQDDVMTALYVFNGIPYVFGQHTLGTIQGTTDGTFYYSPISTTVGCVDNRTIQTRSIVSVPTLLWLAATPNKGIYYTNGSVVQYLSDYIEDLTFNLAQISYLERSDTQASQSAFQGGTASAGIDLTSDPGTIETINPTIEYVHAADWTPGTFSNIAQVGDNLAVPTKYNASLALGTLTGDAQVIGSNVTLPTGTAFTGENIGNGGSTNTNIAYNLGGVVGAQIATPMEPQVSGSLTGFQFWNFSGWSIGQSSPGSLGITFAVWNDSLGQPGSTIYTQVISSPLTWDGIVPSMTAVPMIAGQRYWIGLILTNYKVSIARIGWSSAVGRPAGALIDATSKYYDGSSWNNMLSGAFNVRFALVSTYSATAIPKSGSWTSLVYDTQSTSIPSSSMTIALTATYPSSTSVTVDVEGSPDQSSWTTTDTLTDPATGTISLTGGTYRYWRVVYTLSTSNNVRVPLIGAPTIKFATSGTWTSAAILCTTDITSLVALTANTLVPAGTTVTMTIATSASIGSGYSAFTAIGLAAANKYAKIRATITTDSGNVTSATLVSAELDWAITSTLISSAIDTGATPAGWGIFQYNQVGMTGTVAFYFRSASTSGGLTGASWSAVANGAYPTVSVLEFCQWKAQLSATVDNVPMVNSVTVNWLLTSGNNIRAASLFFNKSYYLAVAQEGSTSNDILIELDYEGNWRVHSGVAIKTMGLYFNDAFYAEATSGKILNAFRLPTDNGTNIAFDLRTKCFDLGDNLHLKTIRSCKVTGTHTGTTLHVYYSVDKGANWIEMLNSSGTLGYVTNVSNSEFVEYFIPNFDGSVATSGRNVIFRVTSVDAFPCQILSISPTLYGHKGKAITEAMA